MGTGRSSDHVNDRHEPCPGGHGILQELEPSHSGRELLGGDPRTDDDRGQEVPYRGTQQSASNQTDGHNVFSEPTSAAV